MARLDFEMGFWFMARLTVCDIALSLMIVIIWWVYLFMVCEMYMSFSDVFL